MMQRMIYIINNFIQQNQRSIILADHDEGFPQIVDHKLDLVEYSDN